MSTAVKGSAMELGGSAFLIAVGVIIAFGLRIRTGLLDLSIVGWILITVGLTGLLLSARAWYRRLRARPDGSDPPRVP